MLFPTVACFTFTGMHADAELAMASASEQASAFLKTHAWRTSEGLSPYSVTTTLHKEVNGYIFVITMLGPPEELS